MDCVPIVSYVRSTIIVIVVVVIEEVKRTNDE